MIFILDCIITSGDPASYQGLTLTRHETGALTWQSNLGDPELDWLLADQAIQFYRGRMETRILTGAGVNEFLRTVPGWELVMDPITTRNNLRRVRAKNNAP